MTRGNARKIALEKLSKNFDFEGLYAYDEDYILASVTKISNGDCYEMVIDLGYDEVTYNAE